MRKQLVALVLPVLLLGFGCTPNVTPIPGQSSSQAFGKSFAIQVGKTVTFEDGLNVMLEKINDSRCQKGVVCIWQGELSPVLQLSGGTMKQKTELILGTERTKDAVSGDYRFTLIGATTTAIELSVQKGTNPAQDARIRVTSPVANQTVKSPLAVTGEARGPWYFEAQFPVRLLNADGMVLASTPAHAQGEWTTPEFVPFSASLTFKAQAAGSKGTLVLQKDNPSGLPENEASISIPVKF